MLSVCDCKFMLRACLNNLGKFPLLISSQFLWGWKRVRENFFFEGKKAEAVLLSSILKMQYKMSATMTTVLYCHFKEE